MASSLKLVCVLVLCMVMTAPMALAVDCNQVTSELAPCYGYLMSNGEGPAPADCCSGIQAVNNAAQTTADRQQICQCFKNAAQSASGINTNTAAQLPSKCGITIPYQMSASTNCSSIQ
ncbi:hypothetical protein Patl1_31534 [Pistacia atlantica]|uniref:Uncharacterized protein n=1 Tax=Pistacia atlantica TaxID=434234 RepID=A0ACC1AP18_9ROSI|nr:hypothetical protein Patl1_31534 [Pistacia atlantica]